MHVRALHEGPHDRAWRESPRSNLTENENVKDEAHIQQPYDKQPEYRFSLILDIVLKASDREAER